MVASEESITGGFAFRTKSVISFLSCPEWDVKKGHSGIKKEEAKSNPGKIEYSELASIDHNQAILNRRITNN